MANSIAGLDAADFLAATLALLPQGPAWPDSPGDAALQVQFWTAIADGMGALHGRAADLTERESDPAQTGELLEQWEFDYGLPDICTPVAATLAQRHAALLTKIAAQGRPLFAYYVGLAATLGYAVTITVTAPNQWTVHAPAVTLTLFRVNEATAGEALAWSDAGPLECRLRRVTPAWIELLFAYS